MGIWEEFQAYVQANTPRNTRPAISPARVIDQGLLGGRIGQMPQRAQSMHEGLLGAPAELKQLTSPEFKRKLDEQLKQPAAIDRDKMVSMGMDLLQTTVPLGGLIGTVRGAADDAGGLLGKSAGSSPNFDAWNVKTGAQQTLDGGAIRVPFVDDAGEEYGSLVYRETPNEIIIDGLGRNRSDRTNKGAPSRAVKAVIEKALAEGKTVRATSGGFAKNYWGGPMGFKVDQATDSISPDYIFDAEQAAKVLSGDVNSTIWGHERGYGAMFEDMYGRSLKK